VGHRVKTGGLLLLTGAAGGGLALQARVNGELAVRAGSPLAAAVANIGVGLAVVTLAVAVRRPPRPVVGTGVPARWWYGTGVPARWWYGTGGLCAAGFVLAVVVATPRLGVALVTVAVAAGMTAGGLAADGVGLGPAGRLRPTAPRLAGATLAVAAVAVSSAGAVARPGGPGYVAVAVAGGVAVSWQQPINSRLAQVLGDPRLAAVASFATGTAVIGALTLAAGTRPDWPAAPLLYTGGLLAAAYVLVAIPVVGRLGALRLALATMTGQLVAAAVLDAVAPIGDQGLTPARLAGVALAVTAVAVATAGRRAGTPGRSGVPGRRSRRAASARSAP
jgi:transporter family-2 protein